MKYINNLIENFRLKSQAKDEFLLIIGEFKENSLSFSYRNTTRQSLVNQIENFLKNYKDYHDIDKYYKKIFLDDFLLFNEGKTLLTAACFYAPQYIETLLKNGADVNKKDYHSSPFSYLLRHNDAENYIDLLLNYGLEVGHYDLSFLKNKRNTIYKKIKAFNENEKFKNTYKENLDNAKKRRPIL